MGRHRSRELCVGLSAVLAASCSRGGGSGSSQGQPGRAAIRKTLIVSAALLVCSFGHAREIHVKYRPDPVDVDNGHFRPLQLKPSSVVEEAYYDAENRYLLVRLKGTFYHYCGIPHSVVSAWVAARSPGSFYDSIVRWHFDCRVNPVPPYSS